VAALCDRCADPSSETPELERLVCAQTLTNLSIHIEHEQLHHYTRIVHVRLCGAVASANARLSQVLYARLWTQQRVNGEVLKLLVNMSAEQHLVTSMLGERAPAAVHALLDHDQVRTFETVAWSGRELRGPEYEEWGFCGSGAPL